MRRGNFLWMAVGLAMLCAAACRAQEPAAPDGGASTPPQQGDGRGRGPGGPRPLMGKITSIDSRTMVLAKQDGTTVTINLSAETEFRKDREPAKAAEFKVGDTVMVRGEENPDHTVTAKIVGARTAGPGGGPGSGPGYGGGRRGPGGGGPGEAPMGTLGKDYVTGEIKSIDAPKLTVLRTDNVTQTLELNEETSLRRGRESITMADIQVGDHLIARGAVEKDAFLPKSVMVMNAEQWQRMQQRAAGNGAERPGDAAAPPAPPEKPQE